MESQELQQNLMAFNRKYRQSQRTILNGVDIDATEALKSIYEQLVAERGLLLRQLDEEQLKVITKYIQGCCPRKWLLLMGGVGTGKSTYMKAIERITRFCNQDAVTVAVKASECGEFMKNDPDFFRKIKTADFLFIDDFGFGGETEMVNNYGVKSFPINDIIEKRYDSGKLTVFTTNLSGKQIEAHYGERIHSRLCEMCNVVLFKNVDYRKSNQ